MNQYNSKSKVGITDPNSGAVYTSGVKSGQGIGLSSSALSSSAFTSSTSLLSSMGYSGTSASSVDVQQLKQQIQNIQSQLRQSSSPSHTDAANRLKDVYQLLS